MISPLIDPALDTELAEIEMGPDNLPTAGIGTGAAVGREILHVAGYTLVTASHFSGSGLGLSTTGTEAHVLLTGTPGPGSAARRGILRLVESPKLRAPRWHAEKQCIDLTLHHTVLPLVLAQLEKPRRILWLALFENGRVYGDLHAGDGPGDAAPA